MTFDDSKTIFKYSTKRNIDFISTSDLNESKLLKGQKDSVKKNIRRSLTVISKRFHFVGKNNECFNLFDSSIHYDARLSPMFMFEAFDWLSLLIAANLDTRIGFQSDGETDAKTGNYSSKNHTSAFINYTKFIMKNIDSLKDSYGYLHIATSQTYANTTSLLVACDWFKESAFNDFIKSLNTQHEQDKSRLLLVLVYWMNNISYELLNADVTQKLDGLLSAFMSSIVGEFNPILKPHETADTTIAELIAQQIFYEYRYTSWKRPENPLIYLSQDEDSTKLPLDDYDLNNIDFAHAVNNNVSEVTEKFNEYFKENNLDGLLDFVFNGLSNCRMGLKYGTNIKQSKVDPETLKGQFLVSKQFKHVRSITNKEQRWKQLLIELDKFLNSTDTDINGLLATISNIKSLKSRYSMKNQEEFWDRINKNLATPKEIKSERKKQVEQREISKNLIQDLLNYLNEQTSNDETKSDEEWIKTQKEIYKRKQKIVGLPNDSSIPFNLLSTIFKP